MIHFQRRCFPCFYTEFKSCLMDWLKGTKLPILEFKDYDELLNWVKNNMKDYPTDKEPKVTINGNVVWDGFLLGKIVEAEVALQ